MSSPEEKALKLARERLDNAHLQMAQQEIDGTLDELRAAFDAVSHAQRELARSRGEEYAIPVPIGFVPESAVSGPLLLQSERRTFLVFNAMRNMPDGRREDAGCGIIEFKHCSITKFGYPNDEALPGHPLYERGLLPYAINEVIDSRWDREMTRQNRVAFPNTPDSTARHFIVTFHDSTFECVAGDFVATLSEEKWTATAAALLKRAMED
jgi:hypothetical protein